MNENELRSLEEKLNKKGIYDVRQIARALNVHSEFPQKPKIIEAIIGYARGEVAPKPHSLRGAPPKSYEHDSELVAEIELLRKSAEDNSVGVSDGSDETSRSAEGVLYADGRLRTAEGGADVSPSLFTRYGLRTGDVIKGSVLAGNDGKSATLFKIISINGLAADGASARRNFSSLTHVYPDKFMPISRANGDILCREIDFFCPLGFGERAFVTGADNSACLEALKSVARGICAGFGGVEVVILLVNARPEDATYFSRAFGGAMIFASTFDKPEGYARVTAVTAFEYAKRVLEQGKDAVVLADGLFGGQIEKEALKKMLYSACNAEEGGSLTVLSTIADDCPYLAEMLAVAGAVARVSENRKTLDVKRSRSDRAGEYLGSDGLSAAENLRANYSGGEIESAFAAYADNAQITEKYKNGR